MCTPRPPSYLEEIWRTSGGGRGRAKPPCRLCSNRAELRGKISAVPGPEPFLRVTPRPPAPRGQSQDQGGGEPGRHVPTALRPPRAHTRRHRARLQAAAGSRTRLARHEICPGLAARLPPARPQTQNDSKPHSPGMPGNSDPLLSLPRSPSRPQSRHLAARLTPSCPPVTGPWPGAPLHLDAGGEPLDQHEVGLFTEDLIGDRRPVVDDIASGRHRLERRIPSPTSAGAGAGTSSSTGAANR